MVDVRRRQFITLLGGAAAARGARAAAETADDRDPRGAEEPQLLRAPPRFESHIHSANEASLIEALAK